SPLLQDSPGVADVPIVTMQNEFCQLDVTKTFQVDRFPLRLTVGDLVDAAVATVVDLDLVAVTGLHVVPVDHVCLTVRAVAEVQYLRGAVAGQQKVRTMAADVT